LTVGNVDASAGGTSGNGGEINLTSAATSGSLNMEIFSTVQANGGTSSGNAGSVSVSYTGPLFGNGIQLDSAAEVNANSASGGGTGVSFSNTGTANLQVTSQGGTTEALNSTLIFTPPSGMNATLNFGLGGVKTSKTVLSPINASGLT